MGKKKQQKQQKPKKGQKNRKSQNIPQGKRGKGRTKTSSGWNKYFNSFQEYLKQKDITMRDVDGDGNCLFRSIADQIEGNEDNHRVYRDISIKYMTEHKDYFTLFLDEDENIDEYIKDMQDNGTWGGHFELVALSAVLGCNFCLHLKDNDPYVVKSDGKGTKNKRIYHLAYHVDQHYSSVRKIDDDTKQPAQEIEIDKKFLQDDEDNEIESTSSEDKNKEEEELKLIQEEKERKDKEYFNLMSRIDEFTYFDAIEELWIRYLDPFAVNLKVITSNTSLVSNNSPNGTDNTNAPGRVDNTNSNSEEKTDKNSDKSNDIDTNPADVKTDVPLKTSKGWSKINKKKKVGPNDPCSCGSGKKLKKCCKVAH